MLRIIIAIIGSICCFCSYGQLSPKTLGFTEYSLNSKTLGKVIYYVSSNNQDNDLPVLLYLDGSGPYPLFQYTEMGIGSTVVLNFQELSKTYRIVLISKPSVPFIDSVITSANGMPIYPEPDEYRKRLSLEWRVKAANDVINEVLSKQGQQDLTVLGFSEGAQVGPYLAALNPKVDQLILFAGNGLNQFFDPIINARLKAKVGALSEEEAQTEIDSLFAMYKSIYNNPTSTNNDWWGHSYLRWASFTAKDPIDALRKLDIPIYIANGSLDENSVLSADYIYLDFLRLGKTNLTYKTYPNCDHQFNELKIENGQVISATPRLNEALDAALKWLSENQEK